MADHPKDTEYRKKVMRWGHLGRMGLSVGTPLRGTQNLSSLLNVDFVEV